MPGGNPTPLDLLRFHRPERQFFATLIGRLGLDRDRMKWVMSLWLWLESIGHHDFIRRVSANADHVVLRFVAEAESCLARVADRHGAAASADELIPLTASLMSEPMDLRFFEFHGNVAVAGVKRFYEKVASVVFDERAMGIAAAVFGEAGSSRGLVGPAAAGSRLNPMAEPWSPAVNHSPEDQRSVFITFSRGHPLTREEIAEFFNARFGKCVEMVMIERAGRSSPMYGRVIFTNASMIAIVLNGQQTAKFMIKGKHLWARIYVPRQPMA